MGSFIFSVTFILSFIIVVAVNSLVMELVVKTVYRVLLTCSERIAIYLTWLRMILPSFVTSKALGNSYGVFLVNSDLLWLLLLH
jgi:hypothetical protein